MSADQRKQHLLEAARRAFSRRGDVAGTTMRDIASEAGVSEGIIYRHFESKEDLFYEAAIRPLNEAFELGEEKMELLVPDLPGVDRHKLVVAYYREMIEMLSDLIPLLGLVLFGDPRHADPFYRDVLVPALDRLEQRWHETYHRVTGRDDLAGRNAVLAHFGVALAFALDQRRSAEPADVGAIAEALAREQIMPLGPRDRMSPGGDMRNTSAPPT